MPGITVSPFTQLPPDRDHPYRAEAAAVYPRPERGAVLRWDAGPGADPSVIFWEAPHCETDQCGSPCGHREAGAGPTPGQAAHDTWCADDDWHLLDDEARGLWEDTARAAHEAYAAAAGEE